MRRWRIRWRQRGRPASPPLGGSRAWSMPLRCRRQHQGLRHPGRTPIGPRFCSWRLRWSRRTCPLQMQWKLSSPGSGPRATRARASIRLPPPGPSPFPQAWGRKGKGKGLGGDPFAPRAPSAGRGGSRERRDPRDRYNKRNRYERDEPHDDRRPRPCKKCGSGYICRTAPENRAIGASHGHCSNPEWALLGSGPRVGCASAGPADRAGLLHHS